MAELTTLESKLGEVVGLAMAAQEATKKVLKLPELESDLKQRLEQMQEEAKEAQRRGTEIAGKYKGKKSAILEEARETKSKAGEMLSTYLDEESDALDGFEFLTMAEAGEVGHWSVLETLNQRARDAAIRDYVEWGLPIQQRHFTEAKQAAAQLASEKDPREPA
jgi:predicted nuclease with TOPRIM domain